MFALNSIKRFFRIVSTSSIDSEQQYRRLKLMERDIGVPVKIAVLGLMAYFLFFSEYVQNENLIVRERVEIALDPVQQLFLGYLLVNVGAIMFFLFFNRWPLRVVHWVTLVMNFIDGLVVSALVVITGGLDSMVYWVFIVLIVRNAISVPIPVTQISMNLLTTAGYATAIFIWKGWIVQDQLEVPKTLEDVLIASQTLEEEYEGSLFTIRVFFLVLMTALCYGVQVLFDRDRQAQLDAREYALRREQLRSTGRLAAEIAHQVKNPLGIINNAAFALGQATNENETAKRHVALIREEVNKADQIVTKLMGYAQLVEGRLAKLDVNETLEAALSQVFPKGSKFGTRIRREYGIALPPLLAQPEHISEVFVNIIQNAREVMENNGEIRIKTGYEGDYTFRVSIEDNGPGIQPEHFETVFEPYHTTKEKGTGLGLAIVKHNTELYGGMVKIESELGKYTRFNLIFPGRTALRLQTS